VIHYRPFLQLVIGAKTYEENLFELSKWFAYLVFAVTSIFPGRDFDQNGSRAQLSQLF